MFCSPLLVEALGDRLNKEAQIKLCAVRPACNEKDGFLQEVVRRAEAACARAETPKQQFAALQEVRRIIDTAEQLAHQKELIGQTDDDRGGGTMWERMYAVSDAVGIVANHHALTAGKTMWVDTEQKPIQQKQKGEILEVLSVIRAAIIVHQRNISQKQQEEEKATRQKQGAIEEQRRIEREKLHSLYNQQRSSGEELGRLLDEQK